MSSCNETTCILNAESQDQLIKARDGELARIIKLRFVLAELGRMRAKDIDLPEKEQVEWALKMISIRSYLDLNVENSDCLLNLEMCRNVPISYTERKAIRQHLMERLRATCTRIAKFGRRMRADLPEIFAEVHLGSGKSTNNKMTVEVKTIRKTYADQLQELELQRRDNLLKLVELRNRKCALLKAAVELKLGPYKMHELEITYAKSRMNHVKARLLRGFLINDLTTRSEHSLKAIKEVEHFIDESLEQAEKEKS